MAELKRLLNDSLTSVQPADVGAANTPTPASDTVLAVDRWGRRRGRELSDEWGAMEGAPEAEAPVATDALSSLFDTKPQLAQAPADQHRARWWQQLMETPEYRALHARTAHSPSLSRLGAAVLARQWMEYVATNPEPPDNGDGDGGEEGEGEDLGQTLARMRSTQQAVTQALDDVQTAEAAAAGLGVGDVGSLDSSSLAGYMEKIRDNATLRAILQMAGRYITRARSLQRKRLDAPRGEIAGIELSGDVARLLPFELMQVAGAAPELELLALHRLASRRSLSYKQQKHEPVELGPIVVSVDESGSMAGDEIVCAKGLALAMAWIARQQKRPYMLIGFSGGSTGTVVTSDDSTDQLINWCCHFFGGGTSLDVPVEQMPELWKRLPPDVQGRADYILITDGIVRCPDAVSTAYRTWASQMQVRTYGVLIGQTHPGGIAEIADRFWCVPDLNLDRVAIESLLSIGA
jgi:uncharacterized protein with von Willebrand factor type A (vWA) domain